MVVVLNKSAGKKNILKSLEDLLISKKKKGVDLHKYCGAVKLDKSPLDIQKEMRDEWE